MYKKKLQSQKDIYMRGTKKNSYASMSIGSPDSSGAGANIVAGADVAAGGGLYCAPHILIRHFLYPKPSQILHSGRSFSDDFRPFYLETLVYDWI